jgi:iron(III) transport system substrate-binding protein
MKYMAITLMILATAGLYGCGGGGPAPAAGTDSLVIYSPHSDEIRQEFGDAFKTWYKQQTGRDVNVSWPDPAGGGGSQILRLLQDKFRAGRYDIDVVYGGGPIFDQLKQLGMLQPYKLPEDVLAAIPPTVAGQPLYDPEFNWYGAAISTFGLIYSKQVIHDRNLPEVKDWQALADPRFFGYVGAGDPSKSATLLKADEIILQAYGYEAGMALLMKMGGNAREFYDSSSDIPRNTAKGFLAVGPCIDFYAFRQMRSEGGDTLGFAVPSGLTMTTCDPIGILRNAPNLPVARKFVEFVMRPEGQRLWMVPAGTPGGPRQYTLERLSVLPALYNDPNAKTAAARTDPFKLPASKFFDAAKERDRQTVLADYLRLALVENHAALAKAWKALIDAGLPEARVAELVRPLITEDEMLRLGREVWAPVLVPDNATPEQKADLTRQDEQRQRTRSDLKKQWGETLRTRYEALAK